MYLRINLPAFFRKKTFLCLVFAAVWMAPAGWGQGCDFTFNPVNPCPGDAVTFSVTMPQGGHIYTWKFGNLPGTQVGNTVSTTFPNHFNAAGQTHQVILKDSVSGMAVCADTLTINVKPGPDPSLTLPVPNPPGLSIDGNVISACGILPPVTVPVRNNSSTFSFNASHLLDWGDGSAPLTNFPTNPPTPHTYTAEGFFPIKLTVTRNNGCVLSKTYTFFNGNVPAIGNKTDQLPQNICAPFDYKFDILNTSTNSSGTIYSVVVNGQVIETFTQQNVPSSYTCHFLTSSCGEFDPGTGLKNVYGVSIIAENPCDKQISGVGQVKVNGPPTPIIGVQHTNPNCPPVTYTFSDQSIGGGKILPSGNCDSTRADAVWHLSGIPGIDWDLVSGDTLGAAQIRVRYKNPGTYFINMLAANNSNCGTADTTISITILTPPTITASVQLPPSNCLPMTLQGTSVALGQGVTTTWTVTPPPGLPATCYTINNPNSPNTSITLHCPGVYSIRVRAVNSCDDAEWSTTVEVKTKPTFTFTLPARCEGTPLSLTPANVTLADGGLPVSITWEFPGSGSGPITLPYPTLPTGITYPGPGPYTVTATAQNNCGTASSTATISFGKKPAPGFTLALNPTDSCGPATVTVTDQSQVNAPTASLRRWTLTNTTTGTSITSTAVNPVFSNTQPGKYILRLELGNGCDTVPLQKTFTVYGKPTVDLKPIPNKPCGSGSPVLAFERTDGCLPVTYSWLFPGSDTPMSSDSLPTVTYSQPGTYTITLTVSNKCGTATSTQTFTVSAIPVANVTATYNGGPRCLPVTLDLGLATLPGVTYQRDIQRLPDPNNPPSPAPFTYLSGGPNTASASVRINDCGIYDFTLTAWNGCDTLTWTRRDTFHKAPVLPLPMLSDSAFCQVAKLNFTGKTLDTGCDPNTSIDWKFPGGMPATSSDPNPVVMYTSADSTRTFTVTATATNGCTTVVATRTFTIDAPEKLTLSAPSYSLCRNDTPVLLSAQPSGGGGQWFWKNTTVSATFDPGQYPVGTHTLVYRKGTGACVSQDSISITVKPIPTVNAGPNDTICVEKQTLALVAVAPASGGTWTCVEKPAAVTGNTLDLMATGPGTFTLRLNFTDTTTKCSNLDERIVTVLGNTAIQPHDTLYCLLPGPAVNLPLHDTPGLTYVGPAVVQPGNRFNPTFYPKDTVVAVFVTLTNAAGCEYAASIKVTIQLPLPPGAVQAGADDTLCAYDPPLPLAGLPQQAVASWTCSNCPPGMLQHPAPDVWLFDPKAAPNGGVFDLTYTVGKDNCAQGDTRRITVISAAPDAGQPQAACLNAPMQTLLAGQAPSPGFTAYWTGQPGVTDTVKGFFAPMLAGVGPHPVRLHWRHVTSGCVFSVEKTFTVNSLAGSNFSIQPPYCTGQALVIQNSTPNSATQTWYDNGKVISTEKVPTGIQLDSGQHLIRLVSQTAEMCPDTFEQTIFVTAPPTVTSTPDKTEGCPPLWVRFTNKFTSAATTYYRISAPGVLTYTVAATATDSLYFPAAAEDLTYTVQVVAENECNKTEKTFQITALARTSAEFGVSYPKPCSGEPLTLLVTSKGKPTKNTLFTSTGLALPVPLNQPFTLTFFTDTLLTVRLFLVSENACLPPDSTDQTIVVQPAEYKALARIEADSSEFCAGKTVTLTGYALDGANTYWLNKISGTKLFQDTIQVVVQEGPNEWVFFAEGCGYDSSGVSFFGKKAPTLAVFYLNPVCPGTPVTFNVASNGAVKLGFGDGTFAEQFPAQHTYHAPSTTYLLTATATSTEGCAKTWAGSVQTFAQPEAIIQLPDPLCSNAPMPVSNIGTGANTCAWQVGDPPVLYDGCTATVVFPKPGLQPLRLIVTSADGCTDDTTRTVFVRETPVPMLDVAPKTTVCTGTKVRFESKTTGATGLKIEFGDGTSATGGPVFEYAYTEGGTYTVVLTATKDGLCAVTATATVQVEDRPPFQLTLTENCTQALGYTLTVNAPNVQATLIRPSGEKDSSSLTFNALQPGLHHLQLTSKLSGCRSDTVLNILPVAELRLLDLAPDSCRFWLGDSCRFSATLNFATGVTLAWSPATGLSNPALRNPVVKPLREGLTVYTLTATDARGCPVSGSIPVMVDFEKDPAVLPLAFTPNDDGANDVLVVRSRHPESVESMAFRVYDKWGALVFEADAGCLPNATGQSCAWDGTLRGEEAQMGTYRAQVFIRYLNGGEARFTQNVELIR